MSEELLGRWLANALAPRAEVSKSLPWWLRAAFVLMAPILWLVRKMLGGLWVGGEVLLFDDRLVFMPNGLNTRLHEGDQSVIIPLSAVTRVVSRFGFFTAIVDVFQCSGGREVDEPFTFRCYGADAVAEMIRAQAARVRPRPLTSP